MTPKPAGPPDGGWGWVVAAAAFAVNGLSYGLLRSLGLVLPDLAEHFDRSAQDTAWVSALALAVQQAASEAGTGGVGGATRGSARWGPAGAPGRGCCQREELRGQGFEARSWGRAGAPRACLVRTPLPCRSSG